MTDKETVNVKQEEYTIRQLRNENEMLKKQNRELMMYDEEKVIQITQLKNYIDILKTINEDEIEKLKNEIDTLKQTNQELYLKSRIKSDHSKKYTASALNNEEATPRNRSKTVDQGTQTENYHSTNLATLSISKKCKQTDKGILEGICEALSNKKTSQFGVDEDRYIEIFLAWINQFQVLNYATRKSESFLKKITRILNDFERTSDKVFDKNWVDSFNESRLDDKTKCDMLFERMNRYIRSQLENRGINLSEDEIIEILDCHLRRENKSLITKDDKIKLFKCAIYCLYLEDEDRLKEHAGKMSVSHWHENFKPIISHLKQLSSSLNKMYDD